MPGSDGSTNTTRFPLFVDPSESGRARRVATPPNLSHESQPFVSFVVIQRRYEQMRSSDGYDPVRPKQYSQPRVRR